MKDIPIIFSGQMVRALLDGRKTMTRRLAWKAPGPNPHFPTPSIASPWQKVRPGDRLWIRENFHFTSWDEDACFWAKYEADGASSEILIPTGDDDGMTIMERLCAKLDRAGVPVNDEGYQSTEALGITPCIHMPRWASRLTLVVTAVKVERLQAISEEDAANEGVELERCCGNPAREFGPGDWGTACCGQPDITDPRQEFHDLWNSLHGADAWDANPEVCAISFTVHKQNIDALARAA